ncbi:MAG: M20 family peptidase [Caldilineae bacterium]|nr:MAG: M20 family peptidase [Caldilineae bacterium]
METLLAFLHDQQPAFLEDLAALVNVDCGTDNKPGVDWVGEWLQSRLEALGAAVTRVPQEHYGDCWLGVWRGRGQRRILLLAHLDTVYPPGTAAARPMRIESGRAIGPGVSDMKGGLLAGLYAVAALQAVGFEDFDEIALWAVSDEEHGSPVSHLRTMELARRFDAVYVLEAARANGDIVSARKGSGQYTITVTGRAAHAGVEPEKGVNAILELAHQLLNIQTLASLAPGITISPGLVEGGVAVNVVPGRASAVVDVRVATPEEEERLVQAMAAAAKAAPYIPGAQVTIEGGITMPPMPYRPETARLVERAQEIGRRLGFSLNHTFTGGSSDGNFAAAAGVPVLDGLGPIGGLDHSPDEYLDLNSIAPRTALLAGLIRETPRYETRKD